MKISQVGGEMFHADKWGDIWWSFFRNLANTPYLPLPPPPVLRIRSCIHYIPSKQPINQRPRYYAAFTSHIPHSAHSQLQSQIHTSRRHSPKDCHRRQQLHAFILSVFLSFLFPCFKEEPTSVVNLCAVSGMTEGSAHNFNSLISTI
jgi:hypothetical protein